MLKKSWALVRRERTLVTHLVQAEDEVVHELVEISAGQVVRFEEIDIVFFLRPVQAPEVAVVRIGAGLAGAADDAEMEVKRARRRARRLCSRGNS